MSTYSVHFYDEFSDEGGPLGIAGVTREEAVAAVERSWDEIRREQGNAVSTLKWHGDIATGVWLYRGTGFTARYTLLRNSG